MKQLLRDLFWDIRVLLVGIVLVVALVLLYA